MTRDPLVAANLDMHVSPTTGLTPPTLADVAAHAGLSVTAVSRALRDMPDIGAATKVRVRRIADELGYRPNHAARALVSRRAGMVGLGMGTFRNTFFDEIAFALVSAARARDWRTALLEVRDDASGGALHFELPARGLIDGLILFEGWYARPVLAEQVTALERSGVAVLFRGVPPDPRMDHVSADWERGAALATEYLLDLGHRRITVLRGLGSEAAAAQGSHHPKVAGTVRALEERGLALAANALRVFPASLDRARDETQAVLAQPQPPTALVCHSAVLAFGALRAIQNAGLSVPTDLSLIVLEEFELAAYLPVAVTTVGYPPTAVAEELVDLLLLRINGQRVPGPVPSRVPARLTVRESTAPPRSSG